VLCAAASRMSRAKLVRAAVMLVASLYALSLLLAQANAQSRRLSPLHSHRDGEARHTIAFAAPAEVEAVNVSVLGLHGVKVMRFCNVSDGVFMPPLVRALQVSLPAANHIAVICNTVFHLQACGGNLKTAASPVTPPLHALSLLPDILRPHNLTAASVPMYVYPDT
jgi:hypothetical protein